eukprot:TRINITY_DN12352_c0_g1_i1.p1 TRINITY_DN12352_c0_g1~~TRINITY_DN12352_c0_g1_i1.p1  ORF type:complete len:131 (+),score=21.34 TRINITY_DN12352_c0_g1_i1:39-431(+)
MLLTYRCALSNHSSLQHKINTNHVSKRYASKLQGSTAAGSSKAQPKFLGVKLNHGQKAKRGNIIVRQRGTHYYPGDFVGIGRDHTLYAARDGYVKYEWKPFAGRLGIKRQRLYVKIVSKSPMNNPKVDIR